MKNNSDNSLKIRKACIVIPTYNEAGNIAKLIENIYALNKKDMKNLGISLNVLVVDDNSPDGTSKIVKSLMKKNSLVKLFVRKKKEGLGKAYIAGIQYALSKLKPDIVFEMDADHSHNPRDITPMVKAILNGADFVIGSRYTEGGKVSQNWGFHRHIISWSARTISKIGLGFYGIIDSSGGFRAIRSSILNKIDMNSFYSKGYSFQAELLEAALNVGAKVVEIPIEFNDRNSGKSKMRTSDMIEGFSLIYHIRVKRFKELFNKKGSKK